MPIKQSLTQDLKEFNNNFKENAPKEVQEEMIKAHQELLNKKIGEEALKIGETFPMFKFKNAHLDEKSLDELFEGKDHLIISFYRGGWCPYCNLELKALQDNLEKFREQGANLVAITSETPDNSLETSEKNNLTFEVLTDKNSELSKAINIAFDLPENLRTLYEQFGIDVVKHNGGYNLQIPATFIINKDLKVLYSFVDTDYTVRLDPSEILAFLNKH